MLYVDICCRSLTAVETYNKQRPLHSARFNGAPWQVLALAEPPTAQSTWLTEEVSACFATHSRGPNMQRRWPNGASAGVPPKFPKRWKKLQKSREKRWFFGTDTSGPGHRWQIQCCKTAFSAGNPLLRSCAGHALVLWIAPAET